MKECAVLIRFLSAEDKLLYEYIRKKAFDERSSMAELIRQMIKKEMNPG